MDLAAASVICCSDAIFLSWGTVNVYYDDMVLAFILDRCINSSAERKLQFWRPPRIDPCVFFQIDERLTVTLDFSTSRTDLHVLMTLWLTTWRSYFLAGLLRNGLNMMVGFGMTSRLASLLIISYF